MLFSLFERLKRAVVLYIVRLAIEGGAWTIQGPSADEPSDYLLPQGSQRTAVGSQTAVHDPIPVQREF